MRDFKDDVLVGVVLFRGPAVEDVGLMPCEGVRLELEAATESYQ